jgi:hypothetical protein
VISCREIRDQDVENVVGLLTRGFGRKRTYWSRALKRLADHPTPPGSPRYGYVLDNGVDLVGVVLLINTTIYINGENRTRCNVSSWYVEPDYRSYGSFLSIRATRLKDRTFFNVSPAPHTWTILETQGFVGFASGRMIAAPAFSRCPSGAHVEIITPCIRPGPDLDQSTINILLDHKSYGCMSLICDYGGERHPFVFGLHLRYGFVPIAHLVYCRDLNHFLRLAGPIGRFLAIRGYLFVIFDSNGPMREILGKYFGRRPRYRKGGDQARLGDVAYSEQPMFGY